MTNLWNVSDNEKPVMLEDGWWQCMNCHEFFRHEDTIVMLNAESGKPERIFCRECVNIVKNLKVD